MYSALTAGECKARAQPALALLFTVAPPTLALPFPFPFTTAAADADPEPDALPLPFRRPPALHVDPAAAAVSSRILDPGTCGGYGVYFGVAVGVGQT
ncbi:hypothetical protein B0H16DRAFT_168137 [Mycena metata]|uniref:Uncharacterized protein n=1 Tax=Mycena metata TaxID=1033252 RepID=A0AAD7JXF8_9AGAR|nr:hypothetical protein B0H16DRAFT_168137 [Mycena metata]